MDKLTKETSQQIQEAKLRVNYLIENKNTLLEQNKLLRKGLEGQISEDLLYIPENLSAELQEIDFLLSQLTPNSSHENPDALSLELKTILDRLQTIESKLGISQKSLANNQDFQNQNLESLKDLAKDVKDIKGITKFLKNTYGVEVSTNTGEAHAMLTYTPNLDIALQATQLRDIKKQIIKIPPTFFKKLQIPTIHLSGEPLYTQDGQPKSAIMAGGNSGPTYLYHIWPFYHELFHRIDAHMRGVEIFEATPEQDFIINPQSNQDWKSLDPSLQNSSHSFIDEDQANYSWILFNLDDPQIYHNQYLPRIEKEHERAKIDKMKDWIHEYSEGLIGDQYWQDLSDGKVDESYWPDILSQQF